MQRARASETYAPVDPAPAVEPVETPAPAVEPVETPPLWDTANEVA